MNGEFWMDRFSIGRDGDRPGPSVGAYFKSLLLLKYTQEREVQGDRLDSGSPDLYCAIAAIRAIASVRFTLSAS